MLKRLVKRLDAVPDAQVLACFWVVIAAAVLVEIAGSFIEFKTGIAGIHLEGFKKNVVYIVAGCMCLLVAAVMAVAAIAVAKILKR